MASGTYRYPHHPLAHLILLAWQVESGPQRIGCVLTVTKWLGAARLLGVGSQEARASGRGALSSAQEREAGLRAQGFLLLVR